MQIHEAFGRRVVWWLKKTFYWLLFAPEEPRRLRVGWRLLLQFLLTIVLMPLGVLLLGLAVYALLPGAGVLVTVGAEAIAVTLSVYIARKLFDRRPFVSLGLEVNGRAAWDFLLGTAISGIAFCLAFAFLLAAGVVSVQGFNFSLMPLFMWLIFWALVGWSEELWMRGYWLQNIAEASNITVGLIISSIVFGLLHAGNPHVTILALANIMLAGLYLGWGYVRTGSLWMPIGLHFGWNLFEGTVLGFPVSGLDSYKILQIRVAGLGWFTGGAFGPEGGVIVWGIMAVGAIFIWIATRNQKLRKG